MTVVFPDSTLPEPTRGSFKSQEEFRHFVLKHQDGKWDSALHSRPSSEIVADYKADTIAQAFPLLFPYGHSGLPEDPAVLAMGKIAGKKSISNENGFPY
jgi:hypothetical protein